MMASLGNSKRRMNQHNAQFETHIIDARNRGFGNKSQNPRFLSTDLHDFGLRGRLPIFIAAFLNERLFRVRVGNTLSDARVQEMGVPQGCILSVTLFSIKINSIVKAINPGVECSLYVDDFVICLRARNMNTIERQLQQCLSKLQVNWAKSYEQSP